MFGKKFFGFAAAVFAIASITSSADAGTIRYSTTGSFSFNDGSANDDTLTVNGVTIRYNAVADSGNVDVAEQFSFTPISFGSFEVLTAGNITTPNPFLGTFTLNINQTIPTVGTAATTSSVQAQLSAITNEEGVLVVTFAGVSIPTPVGVIYMPQNQFFIETDNVNTRPFTGIASVPPGTPTITPLPAAAWGGMALFGILGTVKARRRNQLAA